ncbi:hypothetical protein D3C71_1897940 [compost metagenome]
MLYFIITSKVSISPLNTLLVPKSADPAFSEVTNLLTWALSLLCPAYARGR